MASYIDQLMSDDEQEGGTDAPVLPGGTSGAIDSPSTYDTRKKPDEESFGDVIETATAPQLDTLEQIASIGKGAWQEAKVGAGNIADTMAIYLENYGDVKKQITDNFPEYLSRMKFKERIAFSKMMREENLSAEQAIPKLLQKLEAGEISTLAKRLVEFKDEQGESLPIETTGVLNLVDQVVRGQSYFAPTLFFTALGRSVPGVGPVLGPAASFSTAYMQTFSPKYREYTEFGIDKERAMKAATGAGITLAAVESASTVFQLKGMMSKFKMSGIVPDGFVKGFLKNGNMEGLEEYTQAHIEAIWDVYAGGEDLTGAEMAEKVWEIYRSPEFQSGAAKGYALGFAGGAGMHTAATVAGKAVGTFENKDGTKKPTEGGEANDTPVNHGRGREFQAADKSANVRTQDPNGTRPSVDDLMGVNKAEEGALDEMPTEADVDPNAKMGEKKGRTLSDNLTTTPKMQQDQKDTKASISSILQDMQVKQSLKRTKVEISNNERHLGDLKELYNEALMIDDHEEALSIAEEFKSVADKQVQTVQEFMSAREADQTKKQIASSIDEKQDAMIYAKELGGASGDMVNSQVSHIRLKENQEFMDWNEKVHNDPLLLKESLVQQETESGNLKSPDAKLYRKVADTLDKRRWMTDDQFLGKEMKTAKILEVKGDLERKISREENDPKVSGYQRAVDDASLMFTDELLEQKHRYDTMQASADRANELQAEEDAAKKEQEAAAKAKETASRKKVPGRRADKHAAVNKTKKKERSVATKQSELSKRRAAIQKQQAALRKAPATPVSDRRKDDLAASKARKIAVRKQQETVAKGDKAKQTAIPKKVKTDPYRYNKQTPALKVAELPGPMNIRTKAKSEFRSAAVKFNGKVYEGASHLAILQANEDLETALLNTPAHEVHAKFEHGFVSHDGKFADRFSASRKLSMDKDAYLASEMFLSNEVRFSKEGKGRWKIPVQKYRAFVSQNPTADPTTIANKTGLSAYEIETVQQLLSENNLKFSKEKGVYREDLRAWAYDRGITLDIIEHPDTLMVKQLTIPTGKRSSGAVVLRKIKDESQSIGKDVTAQIVNDNLKSGLIKKGYTISYDKNTDTDSIRFSRSNIGDLLEFDFGANVTKAAAQSWSDELATNAANALPTAVVQTTAEAEEMLGFKISSNTSGVWLPEHTAEMFGVGKKKRQKMLKTVPGQVVIIADNIESKDHFISRWMHEQVGHQGLSNLFGDNNALLKRFLNQAHDMFAIKDAKLLAEIVDLYDIGKLDDKGNRKLTPKDKRVAAEEVIARKAQSLKPEVKKGLINKFRAFLKRWLPKSFVGKKLSFNLADSDIMNILEMAKENVMTGDTKGGEMLSKALQARAPKAEFVGWKTLPKFMFKNSEYKNWIREVEEAAPQIRKWYTKHQNSLHKTFGKDADLFNILLSVTSPNADVNTNVIFAAQTYAYLMGLTDKPGALYVNKLKDRIDNNWTSPENMFRDLESKLFKVTEFVRGLMGDPNATVGDMWMYRAFFGDDAAHGKVNETFSVPQTVALRQKLFDLAAEMSSETGKTYTPREVQAAIWVHINAKTTGTDFNQVADYESGFNKPSARLDGLTPLEWLKTMVPNLSEGPLSGKLGLGDIPMAPISPLAKKRIALLARSPAGKTNTVQSIQDVRKFIAAQKKSPFAPVLTILSPAKLKAQIDSGERTVKLTTDGKAGWSVMDGDIQMIFSNSDHKDVGLSMISEAIAAGGRTLDAYATLDKNGEEFLPNLYRHTFGFQETGREKFDPQYAKKGWEDTLLKSRPDVVFMRLSDVAEKLFTKPGVDKVTAQHVRDNLSGFSGTYTQEARFSKEAKDNLRQIAAMSTDTIDADYLRTGNDGMSVVSKIHEWRDQSSHNWDRFTKLIEQEFLEKFGGRNTRVPILGSGQKLNTVKTEILQRAMNLYIDSGSGKNLERAEKYLMELAQKPSTTLREKNHILVIDTMMNLTPEQKAFADERIRPYYNELFEFAQEHKLIDSYVDDYVKRNWKMPKDLEGAHVTWSGGGLNGMTLHPTSGKPRTLNSIIDGWSTGMELKTQGVLGNLQNYGTELGYVFANRRFVQYMRGLIDFNADSLMYEVDPKKDPKAATKPAPGFAKITDRGFALPGRVLYARADLADEINKLSAKAGSIWNQPVIAVVRRVNSMLKSTILSVSLFHHFAGMRSYVFGVSGKGWKINPISAYKRGLAKIDQQTGFDKPGYEHLGPVVDYLVQNGLTLGKTQDWDESAIQESIIENFLLAKGTGKLAHVALTGVQAARRTKRNLTTGLFNRLFAGLKAEAGALELGHSISKQEKALKRALTPSELKLSAQQTAALINADFGGLHLGRMGRNPDLQKLAQTFLLAPDWTESNWRTVSGMVPGLNKAIDKGLRDNPAPPGMGKVYRKFWKGIALRGLATVALANVAMLTIFGDDEEKDDYYEFLKSQLTLKEIGKGRWAAVPIDTILPDAWKDPEKRRALSVMGHFKDILKLVPANGDPLQGITDLFKAKQSPMLRVVDSAVTRKDWKGSRFTTIPEMFEDGIVPKLAVDNQFVGRASSPTALSMILYNLRSGTPIPMSELMQAVSGESTWISSLARGAGLDIRDVRKQQPDQKEFEEVKNEINRLERNLKNARTIRDQKAIFEARKDIANFDHFNRTKARVGATTRRITKVNRLMKPLLLKESGGGTLSSREAQKLREYREDKHSIYKKAVEILNR